MRPKGPNGPDETVTRTAARGADPEFLHPAPIYDNDIGAGR